MTDAHYELIRLIEQSPELSQRELAKAMGISLGKANYCINALVEKGWVKANNFRYSHNKLGYACLLTPQGIEQKTVLARNFLQRKVKEYEALQQEIQALKQHMHGARK